MGAGTDGSAPTASPTACTARVEGGRVLVEGSGYPDAPAAPCVVRAGEGVTLTLDGRDVGDRVEVTAGARVAARADAVPPRCEVDVRIAPDRMAATLRIDAVAGSLYALDDHPPAGELTVTRHVVRTLPPVLPGEEALRRALGTAGVTAGIDEALLRSVATAGAAGEWVVARGTPARPGSDARVETPFAAARARDPFHTVARGTEVALRYPAVPGVDGMTVMGEPLPAPPPRDVVLAAGPGVAAVTGDDGVVRMTAEVDGRPGVVGGVVAVEEVITHPGDVDVSVGDLDVLAALVVTGDVGEGRSVRAAHAVTVQGQVHRATVEAGGVLTVQGACQHAVLRAGGRRAALRAVVTALGEAPDDLARLVESARMLVEAAGRRGERVPPGRAVIALLDGPFAGAHRELASAVAVLRDHGAAAVDPALGDTLLEVHHVLDGPTPHALGSVAALDVRVTALRDAVAAVGARAADEPPMCVGYLQACTVDTAGSLEVTGAGIFTSTLYVAGDLLCERHDSVVRGGVARVGGDVWLHSIGGEGGARATVVLEGHTTTPDRFHADVVHPGVHVVVNGCDVVLDERRTGVRIGVDPSGRVAIL